MIKKSSSNQQVTKGDLNVLEKKLDARLGGVDTRLDGLDARLGALNKEVKVLGKKLEEKFNTMVNHIDGLAKMVKDMTEEFSIHNLTHQRDSEKLEDHENRVSRLETAIFH